METFTRLYTTFINPFDADDPEDNRGKYWMDVTEDYDTVLNKVHPLQHATSALEARESLWYTKKHDGLRICIRPSEVCAFEEVTEV